MANEITFTASLSVYKPTVMSAAIARAVTALQYTMAANLYIGPTLMSVGFAASEAIPLGEVAAPHWSFFYNWDATNFIKLRNGSAGADVVKLKPGECAFFPWLDSATPYAIADTAACLLEYMIFSL